jgi:hypothetical protein
MYGTEFGRVGGSYSTALVGTYEVLGQSTENNSTTFRLHLYFNYWGGSQVSSSYSDLKLDGDTKQSGGFSFSPGEHWLGSKDIVVYHNSDGTFPGRYVEVYAHSYIMNGTAGGWLSAGTIPRASQPSCITYPNNTENVGAIGSSFYIHMNRKSTSFTHTVRYNWYNRNGTIATGVTDNCVWTIPEIFASDIPNSRSGSGTIYVDTYNGNTYIGTKSCKFTCSVTNANPVFENFDFEDVNEKTLALTNNKLTIIPRYSTVHLSISPSDKAIAQKYSTISKYRVSTGTSSIDMTYSETETKSVEFTPQSGTINVYAIDSRNNSTLVTKNADHVVDYQDLIKNNISVTRQNGVSEFANLKLDGIIDLAQFGISKTDFSPIMNKITQAKYRYKATNSSTWSEYKNITLSVDNDGKFSYNQLIQGDLPNYGFDINNSYNFEVYVEDELSNVTFTANLNSGIPNIALHKNGVGIMGKYNETEGGLLQVAGKNITHKSVMSLNYSRHTQYFSSWVGAVINNSSLNSASQGSGFTYNSSDNSIVVGEGITKVLVSGHVSFLKSGSSDFSLDVQKNGHGIDSAGIYGSADARWWNCSISPIPINVEEGDRLQLVFTSGGAGNVEFLSSTGFTVQEI